MTTKLPPKGLKLLCNDLGEIEQIMQDDIGLPPHENGKTGKIIFSRLADRASQAKARAFLTELRIAHKVNQQQFGIQTDKGTINLYFAGVTSGPQFMIAGSESIEELDKLFTEITIAASQQQAALQHNTTQKKPVPTPVAPRPAETEKLKQDFYALATSDTLTGLYNRHHFLQRLQEELKESERYKRSMVFMMLDIDHFEDVNQKYGFEIGDKVLQTTGKLIHTTLRNVDLVGRLGGDEFGALLLETNLTNSLVIARRLQKKLSNLSLVAQGQPVRLSVSIAMISVGAGKFNPDKLLKLAEKHLQRSKKDGGNLITQE
jgi:diguanylate cyclase (GGDEF)-like protein